MSRVPERPERRNGATAARAGRRAALALLLASGLSLGAHRSSRAATPAPAWVWWEAERPRATNFPDQNPFAPVDAAAAAALSGGRWIGATDAGKTLFLEYDVAVPRAATYELYARKFWQHGPFRWRFDDQPWRTCGRDVALLDSVALAKFVEANWVHLAGVKLDRGPHTLRLELLETRGPVAFDCFLLTTAPFVPRGKLKPGEKIGTAPEGWFAFEPDVDPFTPSPIDLRGLNEARAGDGGFIRPRGDSFVHEKTGRPVRFWAIDVASPVLQYDEPTLARMARFLAKLGVNMVRFHGPLWRDDDPTRIDDAKLAGIHALTAALKKEGIYLELSTLFPMWLRPAGLPGFEGYAGDAHPYALPFFSDALQQMQKSWWRALLTPKNPHTGLSLLEDPTLAFLEIVNEDSLFFWTFSPYDGVPAPQMKRLEARFGDWLRRNRGPLADTFARWGGGAIAGDDAPGGRAGFMPLWQLVAKRDARARDTAQFLAELQRTYFDGMSRYLEHDLGFRGSVTGSNWTTADARVLGPLDKWSNAGCDFMDHHGYFSGPHEGDRASWAISNGDRFADALALRFETGKPNEPPSFDLPIMDLAYDGKPSVISEINWPPPNRYRADLPVLAAAYGALQGTDAFFFFVGGEPTWARQLDKFTISDPAVMGQFPAAALLYRRGLVKTADAVVHLETGLPDLFALKGLPVAAPQNLDRLRAEGILPGRGGATSGRGMPPRAAVDPLATLAGRVEVDVTEAGAGPSKVADLSRYIDRGARKVRSATGELTWDWGRGLVTIDAPAAQGATGLLQQAGVISLGDVTIAAGVEYGSVLVVALDDEPLATSGRMLVQVMSEDRNTGWSAPGQGLRPIVSVGGPPLVVRKLAGRVTFKRRDAATLKVEALDFNGYVTPGRPAASLAQGLTLLPETFYYLVER
jgi:hypothetical protein